MNITKHAHQTRNQVDVTWFIIGLTWGIMFCLCLNMFR